MNVDLDSLMCSHDVPVYHYNAHNNWYARISSNLTSIPSFGNSRCEKAIMPDWSIPGRNNTNMFTNIGYILFSRYAVYPRPTRLFKENKQEKHRKRRRNKTSPLFGVEQEASAVNLQWNGIQYMLTESHHISNTNRSIHFNSVASEYCTCTVPDPHFTPRYPSSHPGIIFLHVN